MCEEKFVCDGVEIELKYDDFDERFCRDGGSYYKPHFTCSCNGEILTIDDVSCGDFGTRIYVKLYGKNGKESTATYGSLIWKPALYSSFTDNDDFWVDFAARVLGYNIPKQADISEMIGEY